MSTHNICFRGEIKKIAILIFGVEKNILIKSCDFHNIKRANVSPVHKKVYRSDGW